MNCPHCKKDQTPGLLCLHERDWLIRNQLTRYCEHCNQVMESVSYEESYQRGLKAIAAVGAKVAQEHDDRIIAAVFGDR